MTNKQFIFAWLRVIAVLALYGLLSIEMLEQIETRGVVLAPPIRVAILLFFVLVPYHFSFKAFRAELKRRGEQWRQNKEANQQK